MKYTETTAVPINFYKIKHINVVVFHHFTGFKDKNSIFKVFSKIIEIKNFIQILRFHLITFFKFCFMG